MLTIQRAETKEVRAQLKAFVDEHHSYIKWADRPSRKMYWALYQDNNLVGCFGLGSAFARPKVISNYMKDNNILFNELGNNIVYCLYGYSGNNVGTQFLKLVRNDAKVWWKERYGDALKAIQTFILPPRTGAMYKADNWAQLGETTGGITQTMRTLYGKDRETYKDNVEIRTFKSGEVKYLLREFKTTEPKIIFVRKI